MQESKESFRPGKDQVFYTKAVYGREEIDAVVKALEQGWLGNGKITEAFEAKIAKLFGKRFGLFVNSGSSANYLAEEILNMPPGSEVITQACTFPATVNPIIRSHHVPVFVDAKIGHYNIDLDQVEEAISPKTRAIFISHIFGNINEMERIREICDRHHLYFVEDSCDTHGSLYRGKPPGLWSDITTTSFYASHCMTAAGGGGMVMVDDENRLRDAKIARDWGRALPESFDEDITERFTYHLEGVPYDGKFMYERMGYNFKATEIQAAFGLAQLEKLAAFNKTRKRNFGLLCDFFRQFEDHFILPETHPDADVAWLAFPLTIRESSPLDRVALVTYLEHNHIQTRPLFAGNILRHPPYQDIPHRRIGDLANADYIMRNAFVIGCHHGMTEPMVEYVMDTVRRFFKSQKPHRKRIMRKKKLATRPSL